ncbi:MAG: hypothetical protein GXP33_00005 [Spirochaetes bacterium]|nr:hypothetical protein [Spirochaetota bacterium]
MKYIDEYRDSGYIEKIKSRISTFKFKRDIRLMEVCGTHTMAIHRFGLHLMLVVRYNRLLDVFSA